MVVAAKKESSRERILEGAAEEFAAAGFAGARIDRIAKKTRLNVRMIYYHFGSKKGLYRAVLQNIYQQAAVILPRLDLESADPTRAALSMYFDLLTAHPRFADVLVRELLDGARHLKALWKDRPELFKALHLDSRALIEMGMKSGELRELDPAMTVLMLTSIVCSLHAIRSSHAMFLDGKTPDAAVLKEQLFTLVLDGLKKR